LLIVKSSILTIARAVIDDVFDVDDVIMPDHECP